MSDENKKEIEVINGDSSDLDISPVYNHINATRPKNKDKKPQNIIIPGQKKKDTSKDNKESQKNSND